MKNKISVILIIVFVLSMTSVSCAKAPKPAGLIISSVKQLMKSESIDGQLEADGSVEVLGFTENINMNFDYELAYIPYKLHLNGDIQLENLSQLLGDFASSDIEVYQIQEKEKLTTFMSTGNKWTKAISEFPETKKLSVWEKFGLMRETRNIFKDFKIKSKTNELDKEIYELKGDVPTNIVLNLLKDKDKEYKYIDLEELQDEDINVTLNIDKETKRLVKLTIDLDNIAKAINIYEGEAISLDEGTITIYIDEYDKTKDIVPPIVE